MSFAEDRFNKEPPQMLTLEYVVQALTRAAGGLPGMEAAYFEGAFVREPQRTIEKLIIELTGASLGQRMSKEMDALGLPKLTEMLVQATFQRRLAFDGRLLSELQLIIEQARLVNGAIRAFGPINFDTLASNPGPALTMLAHVRKLNEMILR